MVSSSTRITELLSNASVLGTGFLPSNEQKWWFAVGNEKYWKGGNLKDLKISFTAIGGHVERGESIIEATLREITEETGSEAKLKDSKETLFVTAELKEEEIFDFQIQSIKEIKVLDKPAPYIIYTVKRKNDTLGVVVYKGTFATEPYPQMEVPALLYLPPGLLQQTPRTLAELLDLGAKIREQNEEIPREAIIYPFGSATILQSILKNSKENKLRK